MTDEPWDADRIAAECAETARQKTAGKIRRRSRKCRIPPPPITSEGPVDDAAHRGSGGRFVKGHGLYPGSGRAEGSDTYDPAYAPRVKRWAEMGATFAEMADWLDCRVETFTRWRHDHAELEEAVRIGRTPADERVTRSLYERATGYDFVEEQAIKVKIDKDTEKVEIVAVKKHQPADPASIAFFLVNRRPDLWQHKKTIEHQGQVAHITADQARRELVEWFQNEGGDVIEGKAVEVPATRLPAPDKADDFEPPDDF